MALPSAGTSMLGVGAAIAVCRILSATGRREGKSRRTIGMTWLMRRLEGGPGVPLLAVVWRQSLWSGILRNLDRSSNVAVARKFPGQNATGDELASSKGRAPNGGSPNKANSVPAC
jgi:hypothetical protein